MIKKSEYKYYNKRIITRDNGHVHPHEQEKSKLNNAIITKSGAHMLTIDKVIKSPFNQNNKATIKNEKK